MVSGAAVRDFALAAVFLVHSCTAVPASAREYLPLGTELPAMWMVVCPTLETAKRHAELQEKFGRINFDLTRIAEFYGPECTAAYIVAALSRIEASISRRISWELTYDENGPDTIDHVVDGVKLGVRYSIERQIVTVFHGNFKNLKDGKWYSGWISVPDRPYMLEYLRARGKW